MKRRPVCLVCLLLMLCMYIPDLAGISVIRGNPLPESVRDYIEEHPNVEICGEVQQCQATEYSISVYLKQVYLIVGSAKIPIKNVRVFLKTKEELPAGMKIRVCGQLEEVPEQRNPGEFDSRQYYACQKIYYFLKDGIIQKKSTSYSRYGEAVQQFKKKIMKILEESAKDDAGVFQAMILGQKENLDEELKIRYQLAGVIHILAISGLHISMLGMGLFHILKKVGAGNITAGLISLIFLWQYGMLTGGSASAMRAISMFVVSMGSVILGRSYDMLTAMALAGILLLLDSPANLLSSSFLLSFGAVVGLGAVAPVLYALAGAKNKILKSLLSSLAVSLTTLPVMLNMYGEISVAGIFLNLLVLPTAGIVLGSGLLGVLSGFFSVRVASWCILPGRILLMLYKTLCEMVSRIPLCTWIAGSPQLCQSVIYYAVLVLTMEIVWKICGKAKKRQQTQKKEIRKRRLCSALTCVLLTLNVLLLGYHKNDTLKITCLDIGQGDCAVLSVPGGVTFLVDGGSSNKKNIAQYQILPYLKNQGISRVDAIMISHTDQDHVSGVLELFELISKDLTSVEVGFVILPDWTTKNETYEELVCAAENADVEVVKSRQGQTLQFGETEIEFLAPMEGTDGSDVNEDGMVMEVTYKDFQALFTGDIGEETEKELLPYLTEVDFLKVGHHGSRYSSCQEFLERVSPKVAVISCSSTNTYGHPSAETIERLEQCDAKILYTMTNGAAIIQSDGETMQAETFIR